MATREFTLSEGSSHKFWNITLNGKDHEVQYGRIGTAGQSQTKSFATEAEAKASYDKLIAEKVKKGYAEAATGSTSPAAPQKTAASPTAAAANSDTQPEAPAAFPETVESATATESPADIVFDEPRRLVLDADDWRWAANSTQSKRKVRPAELPFDFEDAAARLLKVGNDVYSYSWRWSSAKIPITISKEEAIFWIVAMTGATTRINPHGYAYTPAKLADAIRLAELPAEITLHDITSRFKDYTNRIPPEVVIPLFNLFGPLSTANALWDTPAAAHVSEEIIAGLRSHIMPWLTEAEERALRDRIREILLTVLEPNTVEPQMWMLQIASAVGGLEPHLRSAVSQWPDGLGNPPYWTSTSDAHFEIVLGLGDPDLSVAELRRLKKSPVNVRHVRALLACTEFRGIDLIRDSIMGAQQKQDAETLIKAFTRAEAPEVAPYMLELMLSSKAPRIAREWLEAHPVHAANGLLPVAAGHGKLAEAAVNFLNDMRRRGYTDLLRAKLENLPPETADRLRSAIVDVVEVQYESLDDTSTPQWLKNALATSPKATTEETSRAALLPPILASPAIGDGLRSLSTEQIGSVLSALRRSTFDNVDPLVTAVKQNADRRSLDTFSLRLFELWLADGGPSKAKWEMMATGHLGGDAVAMKLAPLVRQWPGESQHPRAVLGLECLRAIGTDTALMQINGIAQKVAFKGIKTKAAESMELIAKDRGMSRAELEDRIVPDCDLDERGTRTFDFGPRKFTFVLGPDMKPMIKDEANQRKPDLPKPNSKDDKEKAEAAVAEWKLLKKQISEVAKIQAVRLEQAMVTGRRWQAVDFDTLLVHHPLMTNIVRLIVWGAFDKGGKLIETFRVTEDLSLADSSDDTYELTEDAATVGVVHPLQLTEAQRGAWGEVLSDYEIVPPFEQIGRPTFGIEPSENDAHDLSPRYNDLKIPPQSLVFTLEKLGWIRGAPMDAGIFTEHFKVFHAAGITAYVTYEGVPVGYMEGWDDQPIENVFFLKNVEGRSGYFSYHVKDGMKLGDVDPIVMSEVLKDVELVASKGKTS